MKKNTNQKGFTLIEVVLAIAIGALIFLLAFIAFRNASINRRDAERRADLDKIAAELTNYASDIGGSYPTNANFASFLSTYASILTDPSSNAAYTSVTGTTAMSTTSRVRYNLGATGVTNCTGAAMTSTANWKVEMLLEKGTACRDNT